MNPVFFFDLDDTLYERSEPFIRACKKMFSSRFTLDWKKVFEMRRYYGDQVFEASQDGSMTLEESYIFRTTRAFKEFGQDLSPEEALLFEKCFDECLSQISLEPGMEDVLQFLKNRSVPMAILTNGPGAHQRKKLSSLNMANWIPEENWYISGEMNTTKPHPEIYAAAARGMHCEPQNSWMIGDSLTHDVYGAAACGWHTIWYIKNGASSFASSASSTSSAPDRIVSDPVRLLEVINKILGDRGRFSVSFF